MILGLLIALGIMIIAPIIGAIIGFIVGIFKKREWLSGGDDLDNNASSFDDHHYWRNSDSHTNVQKQSNYDPYDNHWERSFDWQDKDNDGYDDRDDGFWNEREF